MIEDARVPAADSRLQFELQVQPQLRVAAVRALLHTALFNLLHNAIKYNEPEGKIESRLELERDRMVFTIGNSGPAFHWRTSRKSSSGFAAWAVRNCRRLVAWAWA